MEKKCLFDWSVLMGRVMEDKRDEAYSAVGSPDRLLGEVRTGEMDGVRDEE